MLKTLNKASYGAFLFLIVGLSLTEFACTPKKPSEEIAVKINDHVVTVRQFQEMYAGLSLEKEDAKSRENFLENLITRKVLLLEAQKEGLDQQKDFLKSIKNFWEQSLLKLILDKKTSEIASQVQVSEQEIEEAYQKWVLEHPEQPKALSQVRDRIRWQMIQQKQARSLKEWMDRLRSQADIQVNREAVGLK